MKLQIHVQTEEKTAVASAQITVSGLRNNGEKWQSSPLMTSQEGRVLLVDDAIKFKQLNLDTLTYSILHNEKKLSILSVSTPQKTEEGIPTITLTVQATDDEVREPFKEDPIIMNDSTLSETDTYFVNGTIYYANGKPVAGVYVVAVDRSICDETILGMATSKATGKYKIDYKRDSFVEPSKKRADLIVRVFDSDNFDEAPIASSPLILRADPQETVNLSIGDKLFRGLSHYEKIAERLSPLVKENQWDCLEQADIWLLADRTGWSPIHVAQYVRAQRVAMQLHPEKKAQNDTAVILFALLKGGLSPRKSSLLTQSNRLVRAILKKAVRKNWIPAIDVETAVKELGQPKTSYLLNNSTQTQELFNLIGLKDSQQETVISHFLEEGDDVEESWKGLAEKPGMSKTAVQSTRNLVEINALVGGETRLVSGVQEKYKVQEPRDLVSISKEGWEELIIDRVPALPNTIEGKTHQERAQNYATIISHSIEAKYPTATFTTDWLDDSDALNKPLQPFFKENPTFDFAETSVNQYLQLHSEKVDESQREPLKQLETLFHITPSQDKYTAVKPLWQQGVHSAHDIVQLGKGQFRQQFSTTFGSVQIADELFANAQHTIAFAGALKANLALSQTNLSFGLFANTSQDKASLPTWETLFGEMPLTNCTHCQSALSPSAYLVDLLEFLRRATDSQTNDTALDYVCDERRPDIGNIELTCANSETVLPYIDLVNEILENVVSPQANFAPQTSPDKESAALLGEPEHINLAAYTPLKEALYPWILPFDLDHARTRAYFVHLGTPRDELLLALSPYDDPNVTVNAAGDYLGLNQRQAELVSNPLSNQDFQLVWGFFKRNLSSNLPDIESLLTQSGLSFAVVKAFLDTTFVNPDQLEIIGPEGVLQNLSVELLDRFYRMSRLHEWSNPTISIDDLDRMLGLLDDTESNASNLLPSLTAVYFLNSEGEFNLAEIAGWWPTPGQMDTAAFAQSVGKTEEEITLFKALHGYSPDKPKNAKEFWLNMQTVEENGFSLTQLHELLSPPTDSSRYALDAAEETLQLVQTALNDLLLTTPPTAAPDYVTQQKSSTVEQTLANQWQVERTLVSELLTKHDDNERPLIESLLHDAFLTRDPLQEGELSRMSLLHKQVDLFSNLGLNTADFDAIRETANKLKILNPATLPTLPTDDAKIIGRFLSLIAHQALNTHQFIHKDSLFLEVERYLREVENFPELTAELDLATDWDQGSLDFLFNSGFMWPTLDDFYADSGLLKLHNAFQYAELLALQIGDAWGFLKNNYWEEIKDVLEANYAEENWWNVAKQLHDPLREQQRDALLAHIINQNSDFQDALDVYSHYLLDVEMSSCFETSRIKQATASIQQFVQRVLLNLEAYHFENQLDIEEWRWRKNYRVWEANRKVFIFPENWIEPELRDNKTQIFEALESELLQDDVNAETAESALISYARKLHGISQLETAALCEDHATDTLYLIARTHGLPHEYYICQRSSASVWSGWERVDLDIEGDHLLATVFNRQLYLFWPVFKELRDEELYEETKDDNLQEIEDLLYDINKLENDIEWEEEAIAEAEKDIAEWTGPESGLTHAYLQLEESKNNIAEALALIAEYEEQIKELENTGKYVEIQLAWSRYENGSWTERTLSVEKLNGSQPFVYGTNLAGMSMMAHHASDLLILSLFKHSGGHGDEDIDTVGTFYMDICHEQVSLETSPYSLFFPISNVSVLDSRQQYMKRQVLGITTPIRINEFTIGLSTIIPATEDEFTLLDNTTAHESLFLFSASGWRTIGRPFFMEDSGYVYLVTREEGLNYYHRELDDILSNKGDLDASKTQLGHKAPNLSLDAGFRKDLSTQTNQFVEPSQLKRTVFSGNSSNKQVIMSSPDFLIEDEVMSDHLIWQSEKDVIPNLDLWFDDEESLKDLGLLQKIPTENTYYRFTPFYHPYTCLFIKQLTRFGVLGLYAPDPLLDDDSEDLYLQLTPNANFDFESLYDPTSSVKRPLPTNKIDLIYGKPYSIYNWELFFHAPLLIAVRLMQNQKFEEAQRWFHHIFDPTIIETDTNTGTARYWRFRIFRDEQEKIENGTFDDLLELAEMGSAEFNAQVEEWEKNPFNPHAIARMRTVAYMHTTVMKYLDNLMAWGDTLFKRDTMESLNEAMQIYVLAAQILGPKPLVLDEIEPDTIYTAKDILSGVSGTAVAFPAASSTITSADPVESSTSFLQTLLLFCMPLNDQLLSYWDTVADRLFKLRHCMNIEGIVRKLPLYEPPIDPALLVAAFASGVSIQDALATLDAAQPHYRFAYMVQKANEFVSEVKALGNLFLSILEKQDAEALSMLRTTHEISLLDAIIASRETALDESREMQAAIDANIKTVEARRDYYADREKLNPSENTQMLLLGTSLGFSYASSATSLAASISYLFPDAYIGTLSGTKHGGMHVGSSISSWANSLSSVAQSLSMTANMAANTASYDRRKDDWDFQADQAQLELDHLNTQLTAAAIRVALAEIELENQRLQVSNAEESKSFLQDKFTNETLYSWMSSELSSVYFQAYQLAYNLAKQAEVAYQHELGIEGTNFIQYGHWDSLKKGLLSGEKLSLDLRRIEAAYMNNHVREKELTKHISLALLDPHALIELKENGACSFLIPEALFDLDYPGHYFRRIKSVSLTIPAVTGPYTTLGCTLTLEGSYLRKEPQLGDDPEIFQWTTALGQSISTSQGHSDSGLFQLNFRDERYLPFEGAGAVSRWQLKLNNPDFAQFDYDTISDVIVHINYTAREDALFGTAVESHLIDNINNMLDENGSLTLLLPVRQMFPDEWARLLASQTDDTLTLDLTRSLFPHFVQNRIIQLNSFQMIVSEQPPLNSATDYGQVTLKDPNEQQLDQQSFSPDHNLGGLAASALDANQSRELGRWSISLEAGLVNEVGQSLTDLLILCHYAIN